MRRSLLTPLLLLATAGVAFAAERQSLDADWKFSAGDAKSAESPAFDDSAWTTLAVPHDWSIGGAFDKANPAGGAGAFLPTGVAWYRKHLPAAPKGRHTFVEFDGIQANATVYLNGRELGHRPSGYMPQFYELTPHLNATGDNVLAVRVDTSKQPASRWYAGTGINRHVRLVTTQDVHFEHDGNFVTADYRPEAEAPLCTVQSQSEVVNQSDGPKEVSVQLKVIDPDGKTVATVTTPAQNVAPGKTVVFKPSTALKSPAPWSLDHPALYRAVLTVRSGDAAIDEESVPFGVRHFEFKPDTGFWLNGKNLKLKGVCIHEDGSALGTAIPLSAWERNLATLKSLGVNSIRTSHNAFSPDFLSLCDRMGVLVMDEFFDCWTVAKNRYDYHLYFKDWSLKDVATGVRRDRNHPSIVLYSAGNEIHDTPKPDIAIPILKSLVEEYHKNDPTRPVTQALFRPNVSHDYDNGLADLLDVVGTNYRDTELLAAHEQKPSRKIVITEAGHDRKNWLLCRDNPQHAGQFLWTGIDYLGEARSWPVVGAGSGLLDRTGMVKPMGYERASWWAETPMVFACRRTAAPRRTPDDPGFEPLRRPQTQFPDWTPKSLDPHEETVDVYSNCESVELFLNDKSLGAKPLPKDAAPRTWKVPFEPGTLKTVAYNSTPGQSAGSGSDQSAAPDSGRNEESGVALRGVPLRSAPAWNGLRPVATHELHTAGKPAKVLLTTERKSLAPTWDDVAYVIATVVDEHDIPIPTAADTITFAVAGPGELIATDSADNASHEPFHSRTRRAYQGRCVAIVRSTAAAGTITVTASAPNLSNGTASFTTTK